MRARLPLCFAIATLRFVAGEHAVAVPSTDARPIVAVFSIEDRGVGLKSALLERLTSYLSTKLAASGGFEIVPKDQIRARLTVAKRRSYRECYDPSCQIELGRELAAQKSLATQIMRFGASCVVTSSLYDLKRSTADRAATAKGGCGEDVLVPLLDEIAAGLRENVGSQVEAAPTELGPLPEGLGRADIVRAMGSRRDPIRRCYERELAQSPGLAGTVRLSFSIRSDGSVGKISVKESELRSPNVERCLVELVRGIVFPRPRSGAPVPIVYPFKFESSEARARAAKEAAFAAWLKQRNAAPMSDTHWLPPLTKRDVVAVMSVVAGDVQKCYDLHRQPGKIDVAVKVNPTGQIVEVTIQGPFAGTPMGTCANHAVAKARFPAFSGKPARFSYPFVLR